jgi:hypothetical protein
MWVDIKIKLIKFHTNSLSTHINIDIETNTFKQGLNPYFSSNQTRIEDIIVIGYPEEETAEVSWSCPADANRSITCKQDAPVIYSCCLNATLRFYLKTRNGRHKADELRPF